MEYLLILFLVVGTVCCGIGIETALDEGSNFRAIYYVLVWLGLLYIIFFS